MQDLFRHFISMRFPSFMKVNIPFISGAKPAISLLLFPSPESTFNMVFMGKSMCSRFTMMSFTSKSAAKFMTSGSIFSEKSIVCRNTACKASCASTAKRLASLIFPTKSLLY